MDWVDQLVELEVVKPSCSEIFKETNCLDHTQSVFYYKTENDEFRVFFVVHRWPLNMKKEVARLMVDVLLDRKGH